MTTPPSDLNPFESSVLTFEDLEAAAHELAARGRRAEALLIVADAMGSFDDPRVQLLLARLHLESGTRAGAEEAVSILGFWRCCRPADLDGIALLRGALRELKRDWEVDKLDRDVRWTSVTLCRRTTRLPQS